MPGTLDLVFLHADACSYAAAMAKSDVVSVARLEAGRRLFERLCGRFGGRVIDRVGDSMLLGFNSAGAAFLTALQAASEIRAAADAPPRQQPFEYRIGITRGRVLVRDGALFGHCINMAARIGSLVTRGNIGVEALVWPQVSRHAAGSHWCARRLFAKPDEPFVEFVEVDSNPYSKRSGMPQNHDRNEPHIAILQHQDGNRPAERNDRASLLSDALSWEFGSYFSGQGWRSHRSVSSGPASTVPAADYVVRHGTAVSSGTVRVFASLSSPHLKQGVQTFSRDADQPQDGLVQIMALVSLVGSAIAQSERERAVQMRSAGVHQLVAAGRSNIAAFSAARFASGMKFLRLAQTLEPEYPLLLSSLARAHAIAWRFGWLDGDAAHLNTAQELSARALALQPDDPRCEADLAFVKFWARETTAAVWHYERSIEALPYHAELAADAGMVLGYAGHGKKAASVLERSIANIPNDVDYRLWSLGDVHHSMQDYRQSLNWLSRMLDQSQAQRLMVANKVRLGLDPSPHVAKVLAMQPDFSVMRWTSIQPFTDERERVDFEDALLQAGLPR